MTRPSDPGRKIDPAIMVKVAYTLMYLYEKPREELAIPYPEALAGLEARGQIHCHKVSDLSEQNIWMITHDGIRSQSTGWSNVHPRRNHRGPSLLALDILLAQ